MPASSQTYSVEFKEEACKRVQSGVPAAQVAKGIVNGTTSITFSPDTYITREQMVFIMANYAKKLAYDQPVAHEAVTFADNAQISSWAAKEVKAMQQAGIMAGKGLTGQFSA